jgi:myo-inositol-1(or 4)-monophosphatase
MPLRPVPDAADLAVLEDLAVDLAIRAGRFVRDGRPREVEVSETKATDLDVVTAMDTGAEALLREGISAARPDDAVLGEEEGATGGTTGLTWVIDPIDGTVNYLYGVPAYAVSVAVVVGDPTVPGAWEPVAGAVVNPEVGEVFHARRGGGAWRRRWPEPGTLDGLGEPERLAASRQESLEHCLVGTGFSYDRADRVLQGEVARQILLCARDLRRMGAAALDLCSVAAGRLDAYYESGLKPWDLAAGILVAEEAGARVSGLDGPPGAPMVVAAGPAVYPAFHALLTELHGAARDAG